MFARISPYHLTIFVGLSLSVIGCGGATNARRDAAKSSSNVTSVEEVQETEAVAADPVSAASESNIKIETVNLAGYEKAIADHKGRVVLVNFWATWCTPCMKRFPETVKWSQEHAGAGLAAVSVSLDDEEASAIDFLKENKADFRNLRSTWGASAESFENLKIQGGSVPYYRLYDRSGKLRFEFTGDPTGLDNVLALEEIEAKLKELLAEPAA